MTNIVQKSLSFTKELLKTYNVEDYGRLELAGIYKIYNGSELIGQFFYHQKVAFFAYADKDIKIVDFKLIDRIANVKIGNYYTSDIFLVSQRLVKMILGDNEYAIFYGNLGRDHLTFFFNNIEINISYHLWIDYKKDGYSDISLRPLSGVVNFNSSDLLPVFAGLMAFEYEFDLLDKANSIWT